jgi:hypothetical protein
MFSALLVVFKISNFIVLSIEYSLAIGTIFSSFVIFISIGISTGSFLFFFFSFFSGFFFGLSFF